MWWAAAGRPRELGGLEQEVRYQQTRLSPGVLGPALISGSERQISGNGALKMVSDDKKEGFGKGWSSSPGPEG